MAFWDIISPAAPGTTGTASNFKGFKALGEVPGNLWEGGKSIGNRFFGMGREGAGVAWKVTDRAAGVVAAVGNKAGELGQNYPLLSAIILTVSGIGLFKRWRRKANEETELVELQKHNANLEFKLMSQQERAIAREQAIQFLAAGNKVDGNMRDRVRGNGQYMPSQPDI